MRDDDVREFRSQVRSLQRRLRQETLPIQGVSRTAMQVLSTVGRLPAGTQPRQVADELSMTSSNVAAALRELESAGYVDRRKDPDDARRVLLSVTPSGSALAKQLRRERDTWLGRAVATLLDEREQQVLAEAGALIQRLAEFE